MCKEEMAKQKIQELKCYPLEYKADRNITICPHNKNGQCKLLGKRCDNSQIKNN